MFCSSVVWFTVVPCIRSKKTKQQGHWSRDPLDPCLPKYLREVLLPLVWLHYIVKTGHHFLESKEWLSYDVFTIPRLGKCPGTVQDMAGRQQMSRSWVSAGEIALMSFRIYQCQDQSISVANTLYNFVSLSSATYSHVLLIIITSHIMQIDQ